MSLYFGTFMASSKDMWRGAPTRNSLSLSTCSKTTLETSEEDVDKTTLETSEEDVDKTTLETSEEDVDKTILESASMVYLSNNRTFAEAFVHQSLYL